MEKIADLHENERSFPFQLSLEHTKPIVVFASVQIYEFGCVCVCGGGGGGERTIVELFCV